MSECREFHKAGAEWKKERFAVAIATVGRLRVTSMDERLASIMDI